MTLDEFKKEHCRGLQYDSCVQSPCLFSGYSGCTHPLHPNNEPTRDPGGVRSTASQEVAVCPHCGYRDSETWEIDFGPGLDGSTNMTCADCGREFHVARNTVVTYTSSVIEKKESKHE